MKIPQTLTAGDSAGWLDDAFVDNQARNITSADYGLTYSLRGPTPAAQLDLVGTPSGNGWTFAVTTTQSAALNAGNQAAAWYWQAYATASGQRITAGNGTLRVLPNLAGLNSATYDGRSQAEQILSAINAEIAARINGGATVEYTIGTRSLKKEPLSALGALRSRYQNIVARERRAQAVANGLGRPGMLGVRFTK